MVPLFDDLPVVDDVNDVRLLDGAETVSHRDGGAASRSGIQSGLDNLFRFYTQSA
jgi:hypothetical protein